MDQFRALLKHQIDLFRHTRYFFDRLRDREHRYRDILPGDVTCLESALAPFILFDKVQDKRFKLTQKGEEDDCDKDIKRCMKSCDSDCYPGMNMCISVRE